MIGVENIFIYWPERHNLPLGRRYQENYHPGTPPGRISPGHLLPATGLNKLGVIGLLKVHKGILPYHVVNCPLKNFCMFKKDKLFCKREK